MGQHADAETAGCSKGLRAASGRKPERNSWVAILSHFTQSMHGLHCRPNAVFKSGRVQDKITTIPS